MGTKAEVVLGNGWIDPVSFLGNPPSPDSKWRIYFSIEQDGAGPGFCREDDYLAENEKDGAVYTAEEILNLMMDQLLSGKNLVTCPYLFVPAD